MSSDSISDTEGGEPGEMVSRQRSTREKFDGPDQGALCKEKMTSYLKYRKSIVRR